MAAQLSRPKEFLAEALAASDQLDADKQELERLSQSEATLEAELDAFRKRIQKEKAQTIKSRRTDVENGFDAQLKEADAAIRVISDKRQKARDRGVNARITEQTGPLRAAHKKLEQELRELYRANKVPAYCAGRLYSVWFMPSGAGEWFLSLMSFLIVFLGLPFLINWLIPGEARWHLMVVYPLVVLVFGAPYLAVANATKGKHGEALRTGKKIQAKMRANERETRRMKKRIRSDEDDSLYDLKSFDDSLTKETQNREQILKKKEESLNRFDTVTQTVLADEIDSRYREALAALIGKTAQETQQRSEMAQRVSEESAALMEAYGQYIGAAFMNHDSLTKMLSLVESGAAGSVTEAAELSQQK